MKNLESGFHKTKGHKISTIFSPLMNDLTSVKDHAA
jgi:hypothetical protein